MNVYLKPDTKIIRNCLPMTIIEVDETYRNVVIREDKDRRTFSLSHDEFLSEYADAKIKFVVSEVVHARNDDVTMRTLLTYTEKQIDKAKLIKGLISACLDQDGRWNSNTKERAASKLDYARSINMKGKLMSDRQLRRLYARWNANNRNIEALIERTEKRGNRNVRIDDEMLAIANKFITEFYMVGNRPSVAGVHKKLEKLIEKNVEYSHLKLLSRSTLERMIKKMPEYEKFKAKFGYLAARREFPHGSPVVKPQYLMQKVEIDHTPIDQELFCDESGELLASVWLTTILECTSKMIIGYYLAPHPPCTKSVIEAFKHAALSKNKLIESNPRLKGFSWPCEGLPCEASTDNGPELHAEDTRYRCAQMNIDLHFNPKGHPHFKGSVEKVQRTVNEQNTEFSPGRKFSNYIVKGDYKSAKNADMTLSDFKKEFEIWVVTDYHQTHHRGIKEKPIDAWNRLRIESPPVRLPPSIENFDRLFWKKESGTLQKDGVRINNNIYQSVELQNIAKQFGRGIKLDIFIDETDISILHVQCPGTNNYIDASAPRSDYMDLKLSVSDHNIVVKHTRKMNADVNGKIPPAGQLSQSQLLAGWNDIMNVRNDAKNSPKKSTRVAESNRSNKAKAKYNKSTPTEKAVLTNHPSERPLIANLEDL